MATSSEEAGVQLVAALKSLIVLDESGLAETEQWQTVVASIRDIVRQYSDLDRRLPHAVWHYVADADIRRKEPEYAAQQRARMNQVIVDLERALS